MEKIRLSKLMKRAGWGVVVAALLQAGSLAAHATPLWQISGNGIWATLPTGSGGLSQDWGTQGGSWSFSFDLPNPFQASSLTNQIIDNNTNTVLATGYPTSQATNFTFNNQTGWTLGNTGKTVTQTDNGVRYTIALDGVFFSSNGAGNGGTISFFTLLPNSTNGNYDFITLGLAPGGKEFTTQGSGFIGLSSGSILTSLNIDGGVGLGSGTLFVSPLGTSGGSGGIAATPEPSTWLLFGTGVFLMGFMGIRKRNLLTSKA